MVMQNSTENVLLDSIVEKMPLNSSFAILKIALDTNNPEVTDDIISQYKTHVANHNADVVNNHYANSGFDLLFLKDVEYNVPFQSQLIDLGLKAEMVFYNAVYPRFETAAFQLIPRSSIVKTPLMQSNSIGIIDSGYRGNLKVGLRFMSDINAQSYTIKANTRLVQICHPVLYPIYVIIVDENELSDTARGAGGFGSTGM